LRCGFQRLRHGVKSAVKDIKLDEDVSGKIEKNWFADTYTISINARMSLTS